VYMMRVCVNRFDGIKSVCVWVCECVYTPEVCVHACVSCDFMHESVCIRLCVYRLDGIKSLLCVSVRVNTPVCLHV